MTSNSESRNQAIKLARESTFASVADLDCLHKAVGAALAEWQYVELALYMAFHCLLKTGYSNSSVIYFCAKSMDLRLSMIDKLAEKNISHDDFKLNWRPIRGRIKKCIKLRNGIAHFEVTGLDLSMMDPNPPTQFTAGLSAHHYDVRANSDEGSEGLYVESVRLIPDLFRTLSDDIVSFVSTSIPDSAISAQMLPNSITLSDKPDPR